jgi:hypothetical protein
MDAKVLVPVRYAAWLAGELGERLQRQLQTAMDPMEAVVTRLPRAFLVAAQETPGVLLEAVHRAVAELELAVEQAYPVFHHEMGPLWTGTLQSVFPAPVAEPPAL